MLLMLFKEASALLLQNYKFTGSMVEFQTSTNVPSWFNEQASSMKVVIPTEVGTETVVTFRLLVLQRKLLNGVHIKCSQ